MRLLLDEHLSPTIAQRLRSRGHDVVTAAEAGAAGIDDSRVLALAVADRRTVVTNNIQDFRPLHAAHLMRGTAHYGIVLVPSGKYSLKRDRLGSVITALDQLLTSLPADEALCDRELFL